MRILLFESPPAAGERKRENYDKTAKMIARAVALAFASVLQGSFIVRVRPPPFPDPDAGRSRY